MAAIMVRHVVPRESPPVRAGADRDLGREA